MTTAKRISCVAKNAGLAFEAAAAGAGGADGTVPTKVIVFPCLFEVKPASAGRWATLIRPSRSASIPTYGRDASTASTSGSCSTRL
jgi:hypothetical protein